MSKQTVLPTEQKSVPLPTPCRLVLYHLAPGVDRPAVVVAARGHMVDLAVFTAGDADRDHIRQRVQVLNTQTQSESYTVPAVITKQDVPMGDGPGCWSWPHKA